MINFSYNLITKNTGIMEGKKIIILFDVDETLTPARSSI